VRLIPFGRDLKITEHCLSIFRSVIHKKQLSF
jgi:hypothetical protein